MKRLLSRRPMRWFALMSVFGCASLLLFALPSLRLVWSKGYVESNWEILENGVIVDYSTEFGWDPTSRYYSVPLMHPYRITIIDRLNRQLCTIGSGRAFRTGQWIQNDHQTVAYEMRDWNQYGMDIGAQLDLTTWMVTVTTRGTCPHAWNDCRPVTPPLVVTYPCPLS
jgi:hypothetical protein